MTKMTIVVEFLAHPFATPQKSNISRFNIRSTTPMLKLMKMYAECFGLDIRHCVFTYDYVRIYDDETPEILELDHNDAIQVFLDA